MVFVTYSYFLGLDNLNIITTAMHLITKYHGVKIDPMNLPVEREVLEAIYQKGFTNFVFQFESAGMKRMLREFKPESFEDLILLVAAYRPGPMDFLPDIIEVKHGRKTPTYLFSELESILSKTYGAIIYQEQVMQICQQLAGYSVAQADNVRRFMSKKKMEKLVKERKAFVYGDVERGIKGCIKILSKTASKEEKTEIEKKANILFDQLIEFAKYAFNKSHAVAYAKVGYITAWLKYHYFNEYVSAAIMQQTKKQPQLAADCQEMGISIELPDINRSNAGFEPDSKNLLYGLKLIAGVKSNAEAIVTEREKNGEYRSPEDFLRRTNLNAGVLKSLVLGGAFDSFTNNRDDLLEYMLKYNEKYNAYRTAVENAGKTDERKQELAEVNLVSNGEMPLGTKLDYEMKYLGMWISGNPVDEYDFCEADGFTKNENLLPENEPEQNVYVKVGGVITALKKTFTKKGNHPMAIIDLLDSAGVLLKVCVFPKAYSEYKYLLEEGKVLVVRGKISTVTNDEGDITGVTLFADDLRIALRNKGMIVIGAESFEHFERIVDIAKEYRSEDGTQFAVFDQMFGDVYKGNFRINRKILERKGLAAVLAV